MVPCTASIWHLYRFSSCIDVLYCCVMRLQLLCLVDVSCPDILTSKLCLAKMVSLKLFCAFESSVATTLLKFKLREKLDDYSYRQLITGQLHKCCNAGTSGLWVIERLFWGPVSHMSFHDILCMMTFVMVTSPLNMNNFAV